MEKDTQDTSGLIGESLGEEDSLEGNMFHVLLPSGKTGGMWVEVGDTAVSDASDAAYSVVRWENEVFRVHKDDIVRIESTRTARTVRQSEETYARVYINSEWRVLPGDDVKLSIRKPGTYVVKLNERNIRIPDNLVSFFQSPLPKNNTGHPQKDNQVSKLDIFEYNVFLEGRFVRLTRSKVRVMTSKPGFYRILHNSRTHVVHTNLVLPLLWDKTQQEEVLIAPPFFRVLAASGEFIVPARNIKPNGSEPNLFTVMVRPGKFVTVKSTLMFPVWLGSEDLSQFSSTESCNATTKNAASDRTRRTISKSASSHCFKQGDFQYNVFRKGKHIILDRSLVIENSSREGFFRVFVDGVWVDHPSYCISKLHRPGLARSCSSQDLNLSWKESLRRETGKRSSKPRWKLCTGGGEFATRARLDKIRREKGERDDQHAGAGA